MYLASEENLVEIDTVLFNLPNEGYTLRGLHGSFKARVELRWSDFSAFEDELTERHFGRRQLATRTIEVGLP